jgi:hypothetical protein
VSVEGREAQVRNGRNVAAWKARKCLENDWLATQDLPIPAEGVRSKGEALAMRLIAWKAPDSIVAHSECLHGDGGANDRSLTFYGLDTLKVRDLEWWTSSDELYHVQVKGTRSWFYRLKAALDLRERNPFRGYQRFTLLRSELLNTFLYAVTNHLLVTYCTEETLAVLPMLFLDYQHIREYFDYYLTEQGLLAKFRLSDLFVRRTLKRILKRAFPREYQLLKRALAIFERRIAAYAEPERCLDTILSLFRFSLFQAGHEHGFDWSFVRVDAEFWTLDWHSLFPRRKMSPA